jgi:hypothetical protein
MWRPVVVASGVLALLVNGALVARLAQRSSPRQDVACRRGIAVLRATAPVQFELRLEAMPVVIPAPRPGGSLEIALPKVRLSPMPVVVPGAIVSSWVRSRSSGILVVPKQSFHWVRVSERGTECPSRGIAARARALIERRAR